MEKDRGRTSPAHLADRDVIMEVLIEFYRDVDNLVGRLFTIHRGRLHCRRGCTSCCVDKLTVYGIEAENIRRHHPDLLASGIPHPPGSCAFLGRGGECRIYQDRPYVCRSQGLPLRWIEEDFDGAAVEMRDICPLNEEGPPLEGLDEKACWTIGPFEERLSRLQYEYSGGRMKRVFLRDLFALRTCT